MTAVTRLFLVDRDAFGSNVQAATRKAEQPTTSKKEVKNAAFLSKKFSALESELNQAEAGR